MGAMYVGVTGYVILLYGVLVLMYSTTSTCGRAACHSSHFPSSTAFGCIGGANVRSIPAGYSGEWA